MDASTLTLIIAIVIVLGVAVAIAIFIPYLKRHGIDTEGIIKQTKEAISAAQTAFDLVKPFVENQPGVSRVGDILQISATAVGDAEQI